MPRWKYDLGHSTSRTLAASVGSIPCAILLGTALTRVLPMSISTRFLVGWVAVFPLWLALATSLFLVRSGKRAWLVLGVLTAIATIAIAAGRA